MLTPRIPQTYFCKQCNERLPKNRKLFCNQVCTLKWHNNERRRKLRKEKKEEQEKKFPEYVCECGYRFKLDFNPLKDLGKLNRITCPNCGLVRGGKSD